MIASSHSCFNLICLLKRLPGLEGRAQRGVIGVGSAARRSVYFERLRRGAEAVWRSVSVSLSNRLGFRVTASLSRSVGGRVGLGGTEAALEAFARLLLTSTRDRLRYTVKCLFPPERRARPRRETGSA